MKTTDTTDVAIHLIHPTSDHSKANEHREAFFRARYERFTLEEGWDTINEEGLEKDHFDPGADFLLLVADDRLLAGCRMIRRAQGILPIQHCLPAEFQIDEEGIEISRMISQRGGHIHMPLFYKQLLLYLEEQLGSIYMTIRESYLRKLRCKRARSSLIKLLPGTPLKEVSRHSGREDFFYPAELVREGIPELLTLLQIATQTER